MALRLLLILFLLSPSIYGQHASIEGKVHDDAGQPLSYVNVLLYSGDAAAAEKGTTTDFDGLFKFDSLEEGDYRLEFSMIGYVSSTISFALTSNDDLGTIVLTTLQEELNEVMLVAKKPKITKEAGKLVFDVENSSLSQGNTMELLAKTPGVIVLGEKIQIKNRPTTIFLNGRRVYLSPTEINSFLRNLDAASIKTVEVITNPGPEYDAESGTVLNITTSKVLAPGYKGRVSGTYEQAIFPKYLLGTAHFFKNDWLNFYGSYSFSPRKENKDQESYIRFTKLDPSNTKAIWESNFNRVTRSKAHQGNFVADIDFDDKNHLNITTNLSFNPDQEYHNKQKTFIYNPQRQLDSTFVTNSSVFTDTQNLMGGIEYTTTFGDNGTGLTIGGNYIDYSNDQEQSLQSDYFLPNGDFLKTIQFQTLSFQDSKIYTAYSDLSSPLVGGDFQAGFKYSNIDTNTGLDYFNTTGGSSTLVTSLSDKFDYQEAIYAGYLNYGKNWEKWGLNLGIRGEQTDIQGTSQSLGLVNNQNYFKLFPSGSIEYRPNSNNVFGVNYVRKIQRPRYQSLNPFRYFLNENNFNQGNPNLVPAIEDKITLSYSLKDTWFFEAYYQTIDNSLEILNFQDNDAFTFRQLDANVLAYQQYSFDVLYANNFTDFWYATIITSTYYLENEFLALESPEVSYTNSTMGFFGQTYNQFTLDSGGTFTSELTARYISNLISGSLDYNNIFSVSASFRKSFWNKSASLSVGVDDIFNTNNVEVVSQYFNQDNSYFAHPESRKFWVGFQYDFGNYRLKDNKRSIDTQEGDRLN